MDTYERVVDAIFAMPAGPLSPHDVAGSPNDIGVAARDAVTDIVKGVFAVHGAVPMDSAYVGSCPLDAPPDTAAMLSASGTRLAMR